MAEKSFWQRGEPKPGNRPMPAPKPGDNHVTEQVGDVAFINPDGTIEKHPVTRTTHLPYGTNREGR